jgi:hypothetical protein
MSEKLEAAKPVYSAGDFSNMQNAWTEALERELALRAENERLQRERDEALAREKTARALLEDAETMLLKCEHREKQARAKALEEAAAITTTAIRSCAVA